jgi:hypothetical protein
VSGELARHTEAAQRWLLDGQKPLSNPHPIYDSIVLEQLAADNEPERGWRDTVRLLSVAAGLLAVVLVVVLTLAGNG